MQIARETEHRYDRKVAWGVTVGDRTALFTHLARWRGASGSSASAARSG